MLTYEWYPIAAWFIYWENPNQTWMMTGNTPTIPGTSSSGTIPH